MRKTRIEVIVFTIAIGFASAAACRSGSDDEGASSPPGAQGDRPGAGGNATSDGSAATAVRAEFGLDQRAPNTSCVAPARPPPAASVKLERVFESVVFKRPMVMAQIPGDKSRWFVAQRNGVIVSFPIASPPANPPVVADVAQLSGKPVHEDFEAGFLGFAFHPKFAQNGRLYVTFSTNGSVGYGSEVGYITSTDNGASFTSYTRVLLFDRPRLEHNGGGIAFGNDGYLYLSFGDGTESLNGQSTNTFFGKVLRIDVDNVPAGKTYGIPNGNPYKAGGGLPEIFARGFRNPYRLSIDRGTGDVWVGDVGDAAYEEVNRVQLGGNYGWPCREGKHDHQNVNPAACPSKTGIIDPLVEHEHAPTPNSRAIAGGIVYRGAAMPAFHGSYLYSDVVRLEAWALGPDWATGTPTSKLINETGPQFGWTSWAEDNDGEVYAIALFQDAIHKLVPVAAGQVSTFPDRLSKTGCVDPANATKLAPGVVPYAVNAQLWSDGAEKDRALAVPDGKTIDVKPDGDFDLPVGSVLMKSFSLAGKRVETRLLVHHDDGDWAGYTYEWNDEQTDAVLLPSAKTKTVGDRLWTYPSRTDCPRCHTSGAGRSLGLELGQLNGDFVYPSTNRLSNQLATLEHIGMLSAPLGKPFSEIVAYPPPFGSAPLEARARAYLHANCSGCHRPEGGGVRATMDLRFGTPLAATKTCGVSSELDDLGVASANLLAPGAPDKSLISLRMHASGANRMPPLATRLNHDEGMTMIDEWIRTVKGCP
jgi:uncharacterized repeat protein (TIGR03806 family)